MPFLVDNRRELIFRKFIVIAAHCAAVLAANYLAFDLRFDGSVPRDYRQLFLLTIPYLLAIRALAFIPFRLYNGTWSYPSMKDLACILGAVGSSSALFFFLVKGLWPLDYPLSVIIIDAGLLTTALGAMRMVKKTWRYVTGKRGGKSLLIYGAGDAGEMVLRDIQNSPSSIYNPIGFIDDNRFKKGTYIRGVRILGTRHDLDAILKKYEPDEMLIAIPSAKPEELRSILKDVRSHRIKMRILPGLMEIMRGRLLFGQAREIAMQDLLPRSPVSLESEADLNKCLRDKTVLVTGAGGSIGSELCRQIARYGPRKLLMFDRYENGLYWIDHEVKTGPSGVAAAAVVADLLDAPRLDEVFEQHRPQIVFHAAAHKHVPLMEQNPLEVVRNNIFGTKALVDMAERFEVDKFVLISTDKAVKPTSLMGMTKRVAEYYVAGANETSRTQFLTVRFGNVLGSNGSVIPLFEKQIQKGGPVTVTHAEVKRFFMLIPEAVHLVLRAASLGERDDILVLEMGEQIKIVDMARTLIRLMGFIPDEEIKIVYTGLRPGEKLFEELYDQHAEELEPTTFAGISRVFYKSRIGRGDLDKKIEELLNFIKENKREEMIALLALLTRAEISAAPPAAAGLVPS